MKQTISFILNQITMKPPLLDAVIEDKGIPLLDIVIEDAGIPLLEIMHNDRVIAIFPVAPLQSVGI